MSLTSGWVSWGCAAASAVLGLVVWRWHNCCTLTHTHCWLTQAVTTCVASRRRNRRLKLLVHNVAKKQNIGSLIRVAVAMGVEEILLVCKSGNRKEFSCFGAFGTDKHAVFTHFFTLQEARDYLGSDGFELVGVEIMPNARKLAEYTPLPFLWGLMKEPWRTDNICLMMGNEGHGLNDQQKAVCDWFVYIPQYTQGTASLNVTTAAAIVMHQFAMSRCTAEASREGEKFVVEKPLNPLEKYQAADQSQFDVVREERQVCCGACAALRT